MSVQFGVYFGVLSQTTVYNLPNCFRSLIYIKHVRVLIILSSVSYIYEGRSSQTGTFEFIK